MRLTLLAALFRGASGAPAHHSVGGFHLGERLRADVAGADRVAALSFTAPADLTFLAAGAVDENGTFGALEGVPCFLAIGASWERFPVFSLSDFIYGLVGNQPHLTIDQAPALFRALPA